MFKRIYYFYGGAYIGLLVLIAYLLEAYKFELSSTFGIFTTYFSVIFVGSISSLISSKITTYIQKDLYIKEVQNSLGLAINTKDEASAYKNSKTLHLEFNMHSIVSPNPEALHNVNLVYYSFVASKQLQKRNFAGSIDPLISANSFLRKIKNLNNLKPWHKDFENWIKISYAVSEYYLDKNHQTYNSEAKVHSQTFHDIVNSNDVKSIHSIEAFLELIRVLTIDFETIDGLINSGFLIGAFGSLFTIADQIPITNLTQQKEIEKVLRAYDPNFKIYPEFKVYAYLEKVVLNKFKLGNSLIRTLENLKNIWVDKFTYRTPSVALFNLNCAYLCDSPVSTQIEQIEYLAAYDNLFSHQINIACINALSSIITSGFPKNEINELERIEAYLDHSKMKGSFYEAGYILNYSTLKIAQNDIEEGVLGLLSLIESDHNPIARITAARNLLSISAKAKDDNLYREVSNYYNKLCGDKGILPEINSFDDALAFGISGMNWFFTRLLCDIPIMLFDMSPWNKTKVG